MLSLTWDFKGGGCSPPLPHLSALICSSLTDQHHAGSECERHFNLPPPPAQRTASSRLQKSDGEEESDTWEGPPLSLIFFPHLVRWSGVYTKYSARLLCELDSWRLLSAPISTKQSESLVAHTGGYDAYPFQSGGNTSETNILQRSGPAQGAASEDQLTHVPEA